MDLIDTLHKIVEASMDAYGLSDLAMGTVTSVKPLEISIRESMAPLPQAVLHLTSAVIEKKIPVLNAYTADQRLPAIVCYENGTPLPVEGGYIILNRGLAVGDKVLLLRVMRGQQFIILSRIF